MFFLKANDSFKPGSIYNFNNIMWCPDVPSPPQLFNLSTRTIMICTQINHS